MKKQNICEVTAKNHIFTTSVIDNKLTFQINGTEVTQSQFYNFIRNKRLSLVRQAQQRELTTT